MEQFRKAIVVAGMLAGLGLSGCGTKEEATLTPAQEEAARHPTIDPNYKGPSKEGVDKMKKAIAEWQQKHANDKVEFNK